MGSKREQKGSPRKASVITLAALAILGTGYYFLPDRTSSDGGSAEASDPAEVMARLEIPYRFDDNAGNIVEHMGYTLSYNSELRVPNWVAYELLESEANSSYRPREDSFEPDPLIKGRQAYDRDYVGSGYDRGHMVPSGDMKWSSQAMKESFYLSNTCPQNHNLNAGAWNDLEQQVRREARYYGRVWVVCGPLFESNSPRHVGENHVAVPDCFFKALLARKKDGSYAAIGFVFPNSSCLRNLSLYCMTVDELEEKVGMDLFFNLDPEVQDQVEAVSDPYGDWRIKDEILRDKEY